MSDQIEELEATIEPMASHIEMWGVIYQVGEEWWLDGSRLRLSKGDALAYYNSRERYDGTRFLVRVQVPLNKKVEM